MTLEEANLVAKITDRADGGCSYCANDLRALLERTFPQFVFGKYEEEVTERKTS